MLVIDTDRDREHFAKVAAFARQKGLQHVKWFWSMAWYLNTYAEVIQLEGFDMQVSPLAHDWDYLAEKTVLPVTWQTVVRGNNKVKLSYDSSPASFYFAMFRSNDAHCWMNGGLIYHGDQSEWMMPDGRVIPPGHRVETYSVVLGRPENPWSVHT